EEIGELLVEPLGPKMIAALGVDELNVHAHAGFAALYAALEDLANVQLAADLLQVDGLALVREGGVAPDYEGAADTRQVGLQALRDPIDERLVLRTATNIGKGQNDHRQTRRDRFFGDWG